MAAVMRAEFLRLVPMTPSALDDVMRIENAAYPFPWTRGNFADSLNAGYSAWVLEFESEVIGYFVLMMSIDEAHLLNITIDPDWQSQGYGRHLLGEVFRLARGYNAQRLFLEVRPSNNSARHIYETSGMRKVGTRRGYYPDHGGRREDAIVMSIEFL